MVSNIIQTWRNLKTVLAKHIFVLFAFIVWFLPTLALAVDDEYLKALEVEAQKSAQVNIKKTQKENSKVTSILNNKEFIQFEKELQFSRPATYRFYEKLNNQEKATIYSVYKEDHKLTRASKTVFDIYFEKNK